MNSVPVLMKGWAIAFIAFFGIILQASAGELPYDEKAEARAVLARGLEQARSSGKNLLVVFGANWCPVCLQLDPAIHDRNGRLGEDRFVIVKVDVGRFDRNIDLVRTHGNPIGKGIPGAAIVSPQGETLYAGPLMNLIDPYRSLKAFVRKAAVPVTVLLIAAGVFVQVRRRRSSLQRA